MASDSMGTRDAILAAIPHRPPFLFVDRVIERDERRIVTEWDVRADLPALAGHYPGRPVLPGVLACEFCFQSAAILLSSSAGADDAAGAHGAVPVLTRVESARFKHMVAPGETLRAELDTVETLANARWMRAKVTSASTGDAKRRRVLEIAFTVALVKPEGVEVA